MRVQQTPDLDATREPDSKAFAPYLSVLHRLGWTADGGCSGPRSLALMSSLEGEGTTTVAARLAATASIYGCHPVLLIDGHCQRPRIAELFGTPPQPGFAELLSGSKEVGETLCDTKFDQLSVIAAGSPSEEAFENIEHALRELLETIPSEFDLVVFDLPPITQWDAISKTAEWVDGVVLVVQAERTPTSTLREATAKLQSVGVIPLGAVLNRCV